MNYKSVVAGNQSNGNASTKACDDACKTRMETIPDKDYILLPLWPADLQLSQNSKSSLDAGFKPSGDNEKKVTKEPGKEGGDSSNDQEKEDNVNNTKNVNAGNTNEVNVLGAKTSIKLPDDPNMPELEDIVYSDDDEDVGAEADMNNLNTFIPVSPILTTRIHKYHPVEQIIRDLNSAPQTRRMTKNLEEHYLFSSIQQRTNHKDFKNCLFACFYHKKNPKWNKKDEKGIVIKNKARLVAQGYTQEEGIDYDEVFAPVARIEAIRLFLAYALFKDFVVYQMDVKSDFLYGKIEKEFYVCQPPGFEDPDFPDRVYKVENALYGLNQAPRAWYETLSTYLLDNGFQRGKIDKTLFIRRDKGLKVKKKEDGIFISQDKYVTEILKKFGFIDVKTASTPMETKSFAPGIEDAYTDSDYPGASLDRKSTTVGCQFLRYRFISWQRKKQTVVSNSTTEAEYVVASSCCGQVKTVNGEQQLQALVDGKKILVTEASVRRDLQLDDEEATNQKFNCSKYIFESMVKNLDNAGKFLMYPRMPKEKDTQVPQSSVPSDPTNVVDEAINEEPRDYKFKEESQEVREERMGRKINDIDKDAEITLVDETQGRYGDEDMFGVNELDGDEVVVESEVTDKAGEKRNIIEEAVVVTNVIVIVSAATITNVELTLAQTLAELKSARPKTKGVVMQEPNESTPTISLQLPSQVKGQGSKDKGKAKMIEPKKPLKKKYQIKFDEEEALRLQAKFDEEDRLAREKAQQVEEANIAWDDIQAKIDADYQLAERLQAQEQQELTIKRSLLCLYNSWRKERSTLLLREQKKREIDHLQELNKGVLCERAKMKELMEIVPDEEEVSVDAIPLATKPPSIVDWKIVKEGKISYYQTIRADGSSKRYSAFIQMLRSFNRKIWKLCGNWLKLSMGIQGQRRAMRECYGVI
ncbi:putative ribonuclease H-like domain-containing protein [Tanacetum coccineum]